MNKNIKKSVLLGLTFIALGSSTALAADIKVSVDGKNVVFTDAAPFVDKSSRTLVPLRAIADELGLEVAWDKTTKTATFTKTMVEDGDTVEKSLAFKLNSASLIETTAKDGGEKATNTVTMDTEAVSRGGRVYAPVRYLAEGFSKEVGWDKKTKTVLITDKAGDTTTTTTTTENNKTKLPEAIIGSTKDNKYTNKWLGLEVNFSDNIKVYTEAEIDATTQESEVDSSYGFMVNGENNLDTYSIEFLDLTKENDIEALKEDDIIEVFSSVFSEENAKETAKGEVDIAGKTYKYTEYVMGVEGIEVATRIYVHKKDGYFVCINMLYLNSEKDKAIKFLDSFKAI